MQPTEAIAPGLVVLGGVAAAVGIAALMEQRPRVGVAMLWISAAAIGAACAVLVMPQ